MSSGFRDGEIGTDQKEKCRDRICCMETGKNDKILAIIIGAAGLAVLAVTVFGVLLGGPLEPVLRNTRTLLMMAEVVLVFFWNLFCLAGGRGKKPWTGSHRGVRALGLAAGIVLFTWCHRIFLPLAVSGIYMAVLILAGRQLLRLFLEERQMSAAIPFLQRTSMCLVLGSALMYYATKKVVSPIRSLAALSARMSELDFEARYTGDSEDEIGVLGHSMNTLSERLKDTIGELKTANNELQKDIEEKIKIDETRKEFIANVSHELKTPIALIQGYAEGLTEGMAEDEDSRNYYCEVIMDEAGKMNKMVKQLLTLTALEFGNDMPVMERFDITALIRGILASAGILLQQKEARVVFEQKEPVWVWADEFKIEEVITNYLNNAMNHLDGERQITISIFREGDQVRITVFNTGQHIPEEDLDNLWTKFYKVDKARTREYGGSGIGLSIVKAIMDSHNKSCGVENVDGGVEFWFTVDSGV